MGYKKLYVVNIWLTLNQNLIQCFFKPLFKSMSSIYIMWFCIGFNFGFGVYHNYLTVIGFSFDMT